MPKTQKLPPSKSPKARRARAALRAYLRASITYDAAEHDGADALTKRVLEMKRERAALRVEQRTDVRHVATSLVEPCTPGHEIACLLGEDEHCACSCGGANHGALKPKTKRATAGAR